MKVYDTLSVYDPPHQGWAGKYISHSFTMDTGTGTGFNNTQLTRIWECNSAMYYINAITLRIVIAVSSKDRLLSCV